MRYVYLHGFASGPRSRKALAFRRALESLGVDLDIPDLAQGDFEHLTISGQVRVLESMLDLAACRLIGSSMGGYVASLYAATHPEVERLVLLAPAFGFASRWRDMQNPHKMALWRTTGWLEVFHYGDQAVRRVHYGLLDDAALLPDFPGFTQPALIFHGVRDAVVPVDFSRKCARSHRNIELRELDSDHELLDVLERIVTEATPYLTDSKNGSHFPVKL